MQLAHTALIADLMVVCIAQLAATVISAIRLVIKFTGESGCRMRLLVMTEGQPFGAKVQRVPHLF
jgi:hypothetical protein